MDEEITEATQNNDMALVWRLSKRRSGKKLGPELRGSISKHTMPLQEWEEGLSRPGRLGGCSAKQIQWDKTVAEHQDAVRKAMKLYRILPPIKIEIPDEPLSITTHDDVPS